MDPVSISLGVITFATALKDSIETIQVIQDSISKYPQNYRNAKRLAEEVLNTLKGIEDIYEEYEQVFNKSKTLKKAIDDIQIEMKSAYNEFSRLAPPVSEKMMYRFKIAFYSFWNRKKAERLLLELKDRVDRCSRDFNLLSSLRTEAHIIQTEARIAEIHTTMVQSTARDTLGVYRQRNVGSTDVLHSGLGSVTSFRLFSFTQSTPMPMTWITDTIPAHDLSKAYLRREVGKVTHSFNSVLLRWSQEPPTILISIPPLTWDLQRLSISSIPLHQNSVVLAFDIQSLLQNSQSDSWVQDFYLQATKLAANLCDLDMEEDATSIFTLFANLWKLITGLRPSRMSSRNLSNSLINLALGFFNTGNLSEARSKSDEAIEILRSLAADEPINQLRKQDMVDIARVMTLQERYKLHSTQSLQNALAAGRVIEEALGLSYIRCGTACVSSTTIALPGSCTVILENQEISDDHWYAYTSSLLKIAEFHDQPFESHRLAKLAVAILNHLLTKYPGSDMIQDQLSTALFLLSNTITGTKYPQAAVERLGYMKQRITILRQKVLINPQLYVLRLGGALWAQRGVFLKLGRLAEADDVYQDLIGLKDLAAAPSHPNLQIPSETEAEYFAKLAQYHYDSCRFTDAIYAAQNAISQYSALEFMDPGRSQAKRINVLALLCRSLSAAHQYDAALSEGLKAIKMIDNSSMNGSDSDLFDSYGDIMFEMMQALKVPSHPQALALALEINTRIRKLVRSAKCESNGKLVVALARYAQLLDENQMIEDATTIFREIHDNRMNLYGDFDDPIKATLAYTDCVRSLEDLLQQQGEVEMALQYNEAARTFVKNLAGSASNDFISGQLHILHLDRIYLLLVAGYHPEALELGQLMVSDIRKNSQKAETVDTIATTATSLCAFAQAQLYNSMPKEALATATEALSLCHTKPYKGHPTISYYCLLILTDGLHDVGRVKEALTHLNEAEKVARQLNEVDCVEELGTTDNDFYENLLIRRSALLFALADYSEAIKYIEKVEAVLRERSKKKFKSALSLQAFAVALVYSSVLYCTLGRHEEGLTTALELVKLKENIRVTSPAISRLVDVEMDYMIKRGAWKSVQTAKRRLTCTHQNEL